MRFIWCAILHLPLSTSDINNRSPTGLTTLVDDSTLEVLPVRWELVTGSVVVVILVSVIGAIWLGAAAGGNAEAGRISEQLLDLAKLGLGGLVGLVGGRRL